MSERLHRAIDLAARAHAGQLRKDMDVSIPYVAHVFGVAMMLACHDYPEDVVVAGLLHDVLEDSPEFAFEVEAFGEPVYGWVQTVTDPVQGHEHIPWRERKVVYIEQIRGGAPEAKAVACADKIHNMESTLLRMRRGDGILGRPLSVQVGYWKDVRKAFGAWQSPMLARYDELLGILEKV